MRRKEVVVVAWRGTQIFLVPDADENLYPTMDNVPSLRAPWRGRGPHMALSLARHVGHYRP
jgi:hypothetical protein